MIVASYESHGVKLEFSREGYGAKAYGKIEFNPKDPEDVEILVIRAYRKPHKTDTWLQTKKGAFVTHIPADTPQAQLVQLLQVAWARVHSAVYGDNLGRLLQDISGYLTTAWLEPWKHTAAELFLAEFERAKEEDEWDQLEAEWGYSSGKGFAMC